MKRGGDGNGAGWFVNGRPQVYKGVNLTPEDVLKRAGVPCVFHTRRKSEGTRCDKNCHTFIVGERIYAHNGTYRMWKDAKAKLGLDEEDITDSEVLAHWTEKHDQSMEEFADSAYGVLLRLEKSGNATVAVGHERQFQMARHSDLGLVYASEFPSDQGFQDITTFEPGTVATLTADGPIFICGDLR